MLDPTGRREAQAISGEGNEKELGCAEMPQLQGWWREGAITEESSGPFWEQGGTPWLGACCGSSRLRGEDVSVRSSTVLELLLSSESLRAEHT